MTGDHKNQAKGYNGTENGRLHHAQIRAMMKEPGDDCDLYEGVKGKIPADNILLKNILGNPPLRWRTKRLLRNVAIGLVCFLLGCLFAQFIDWGAITDGNDAKQLLKEEISELRSGQELF